jgi:tetratricopeptide (TPR) repeat protein
MARKPNKKPRPPKRPTLNQRLNAQTQRVAGPSTPRRLADVRIDKAHRAWDERRYDDAIRLYEQALARHPRHPVLLVDVARAYAQRYRYADAERLVALAQSLYPDDARLQTLLGQSYAMIQQFDRAIACYRRSLELAPASPDRPHILLELANMLERLHQLDAARQCAEEALALAPHLEKARYALAVIDRRAGDEASAEARWRQLITTMQAAPAVIADSWYQIATLADAAGRYNEAFENATRAKEILNLAAGPQRYDAADIARIAGRTFSALTAEHCQRWQAAADQLEPLPGRLALLTSHPRSGTTLLEQVLDSHSDVTSADELQIMSEMVYLPLGQTASPHATVPAAFDVATPADLIPLRRSYWSAMEAALREPMAGRLLLDKNPELTNLLPLVARVFPEMKVIVALRDPRDVVVSCFMQRLPLNAVSVNYLTLEATAEKYARSMRAWLKIRDILKNSWIEVRYEDTVADLERQARTVLGFLDLPWDDAVLQYQRRARSKHVHSPTYEAVTKPVYSSSIGRWKNYAGQLEPCQEILRPFVETFGYA